jgi:hypothetical protein
MSVQLSGRGHQTIKRVPTTEQHRCVSHVASGFWLVNLQQRLLQSRMRSYYSHIIDNACFRSCQKSRAQVRLEVQTLIFWNLRAVIL